MPTAASNEWSPADHPYAIAVSEAQWWMRTARLAILRIRGDEDQRVGFGSRQIDARLLVFALRQLLAAEDLEQRALRDLGIRSTAGTTLARARQQFETALPDIKNMRDALMHFEDWPAAQAVDHNKISVELVSLSATSRACSGGSPTTRTPEQSPSVRGKN